MRKAVLCAAGIALAVVLTDQVVANNGISSSNFLSVDRSLKGDRETSSLRSAAPITVRQEMLRQEMLRQERPRTAGETPRAGEKPMSKRQEAERQGMEERPEPVARQVPEGCETGVSPLAKSAARAPAARCIA